MDAINPSVELTEAERIDRLRLIRSDNVGPRGIMAQTPQAGPRKDSRAFAPSTVHLKGMDDAQATTGGTGRLDCDLN
ncbi:hypothetical protein JIR23_19920 [Bradyrhizobium diazoefficiens]|nr:hypothetical protein [Bradyrhizobium diazoefficiens]QQN67512.1 hypothetical protein JIR23_19920 [Bradyrhizobium diazoefficiens]